MVSTIPVLSADTLRSWLAEGKNVTILDVRPTQERAEWFIPGSLHHDAYEKLKAHDPDALAGLQLKKEVPVVTVCAAGKTSRIAADLLQKDGYTVYSLQDGMKGWSTAWNTATLNFQDYQIIQVRRTGKGCLSYIVASQDDAVVIDASLPVPVYESLLREKSCKLQAVVETHIHADHLSRSKPLADSYNVPLYLPHQSKVDYPFTPIYSQGQITVGVVTLQAIPTPGHTLESQSFLLNNEVLFSGDTLFLNGIGRPDLKADENLATRKAAYLYDSLQSLLQLDGETIVLPSHTDTPIPFSEEVVQGRLKEVKERIPLLTLSKQAFLQTILSHAAAPPQNFLTIVERNVHGDVSEGEATELEAGANRCSI